MICITNETRLTKDGKLEQVIEFVDRLFEKYYKAECAEEFDGILTGELEEEWLRIKNS